ncbi:DUF4229 domain-containing protein [Aquipuribacter nitratireducens]|uniref:DUF4229 domain-containing protein n=1 Tax=Aquipuribacter nitratireducens TaxID=650104 RepID=A0ABW0GLR5_9MICO
MRPVAVYSALRLGMFLVAFLALRLVGVGGLLSLVLALVISMLLSFVVLRRQRDAVTLAIMERRASRDAGEAQATTGQRRRLRDRIDDDAAAEDAALDRADDHRADGQEPR